MAVFAILRKSYQIVICISKIKLMKNKNFISLILARHLRVAWWGSLRARHLRVVVMRWRMTYLDLALSVAAICHEIHGGMLVFLAGVPLAMC